MPSLEVLKTVKEKIASAEKVLADLKTDLEKMERAGIESTFQRNNYEKVKQDLERLKAVYG